MEHPSYRGSLGVDRLGPYDLAQVVDQGCRVRGISDPQDRAAVAQAYVLSRRYLAPFIVSVAVEMLPHLKEDMAHDPSAKVAFLGRDGHSLGLAMRRLDREFFAEHCTQVVVSRRLAEAAVQDREQYAGHRLPEIEPFRSVRDQVDPADVRDASWRLTDYLDGHKLRVGYPNSRVTLVNTGYYGTVQELLAGLYPQTSFQGRYLWFREKPDDPHPGSKRGYLLHAPAERGPHRQEQLAPGIERRFAREERIAVIESLLCGPLASPERIVDGQPQQRPLHLEPFPLDGLNPILITESYRKPIVREAARDVMLLAVSHHASWIDALRADGGDVADELELGRRSLEDAVDGWVRGELGDPRLAELLDSFVPRADRFELSRIAAAIRRAGLPEEQADPIWRGAGRQPSVAELSAYADRLELDAGVWQAIQRAHEAAESPTEGGRAPGPVVVDADGLDPPATDRRDGPDGRRRQR